MAPPRLALGSLGYEPSVGLLHYGASALCFRGSHRATLALRVVALLGTCGLCPRLHDTLCPSPGRKVYGSGTGTEPYTFHPWSQLPLAHPHPWHESQAKGVRIRKIRS